MTLARLDINDFRNYQAVSLNFNENFNLLSGPNGGGKSSLLEAIYLLAFGRSFRTHLISRYVRHGASTSSIFAEVLAFGSKSTLGMEKGLDGKTRLKINGDTNQAIADAAKLLPLQIINQDTFGLLTAGPKLRRQFLDWGVFHVEPQFFTTWKRMARALQQRNSALRNNLTPAQIKLWDQEFASAAGELAELRQQYIVQLTPLAEQTVAQLLELDKLSISFYPGWDNSMSLLEALEKSFNRDRELAYTQYGPHRADIRIKVKGVPAEDILSRGQQKLLIYGLIFAQGQVLRATTEKNCLYLLDDLPSELDKDSQTKLMTLLRQLKAQYVITGIELSYLLSSLMEEEVKMFHVEHGIIQEQTNKQMV